MQPLMIDIELIQTIKEDARKQYKTNPVAKRRAARKQYTLDQQVLFPYGKVPRHIP